MITSLWLIINDLANHWVTYMATALIDTTIGLALVLCVYLAVRRRVMTMQATTRHTSLWNVLLLLGAIILVLPNLRAATPDTLPDEEARTNDSSPDGSDDKSAAENAKEPAQELFKILEQGAPAKKIHDVKSLLSSGADPDTLVELITSSVVPDNWDFVGGIGNISIDQEASQLQVFHVAGVQQAIAQLLTAFEAIAAQRSQRGREAPFPAIQSIDLFENAGSKTIVRVYTMPSLVFADPSQRDPRLADYDALIQLTTSVIDPGSWNEVGGMGSIVPWPAGDSLVIAQTQKTQDKIRRFYELLDRLPGAGSMQMPESFSPIQVAQKSERWELHTRLYPVHDLLPRETKPAFWLSPRAVGLDQLCHWIGTTLGFPQNNEPVELQTLRTQGSLVITATEGTHLRLTEALAELRKQTRTATTLEERATLDKILFPGLFSQFVSGMPIAQPFSPQRVYLYGTCDADRQLMKLSQSAKQVRKVQLIATDVTDNGLSTMEEFEILSDLTIWSTHVSDAGISRLIKELPLLQHLSLRGKQITDTAADQIAAMGNLTHLELPGTSLSDKGLMKIVENRQWLMLDVSHTKVTPATVESLRQTHPHIRIRGGQ